MTKSKMSPAKDKNLSKLALINALKKSNPNIMCQLINYLNSQGIQVLSESIYNVLFNPILPRLWKDVVTLVEPYTLLPLFFQFWGYQKPKTEPLHIYGTNSNLKSYFEKF